MADSYVYITLGNVQNVCDNVVSYQLFVRPIDRGGRFGVVREVTLVHYSGWRAHVPQREDELTGYA